MKTKEEYKTKEEWTAYLQGWNDGYDLAEKGYEGRK